MPLDKKYDNFIFFIRFPDKVFFFGFEGYFQIRLTPKKSSK